MPVQTTKTGNIYFPDGAQAQIKASGDSVFTDLGALNSPINIALNYEENQVNTANAGQLDKQIRNMTCAGSLTLINFDTDAIEKLGGGMFEKVDTAGTPISTIPDQTITSGWADQTLYDLNISTSSSDSTPVRTTVAPTLTSVTLDPTGTPEVLVEGTEYNVVANPNSSSGWSISFISSTMTTVSPTNFEIVVDYGTNTPIANTTTYVGTSTQILTPYLMKFTHTDDNGKLREVELFAVDTNSGGFTFNFKGANEDGTEELPIAFTAKLDTSLTDGRQLLRWLVEDGAQ